MDRCVDIVKRLLAAYEDWPDKYPGDVPEPFLGTCDPERVEVLFLGTNPGAQTVETSLTTPEDYVAYAGSYFRQGDTWGVPKGHAGVWPKYGYFFCQASQARRRLEGETLYEALGTRSLITNLIHWPTRDTKALLRESWIKEWIARGTGFVEELIDLARPRLIVCQGYEAWGWFRERCGIEDKPAKTLAMYRSGTPIGFEFNLPFVADHRYRPFILPVMHLTGYAHSHQLLNQYLDEVSRTFQPGCR